MTAVSPCAHPRCDNGDNRNRALIRDGGMCDPCRASYRRDLRGLVLDYATIKTTMPAPARREAAGGGSHIAPKSRSFGHPAEWASDTAREIAQTLNWIEDGLRDHRHDDPPPHPFTAEDRLVAHAWHYLDTHFDDLCTYPAAEDTAAEINDLHHKIRRALGHTRLVQHLPAPCPWCDVSALVREIGSVSCRECGKVVDEKYYDWLAGWLVDRLIEDYDTRESIGS